MSAVVYPDGLDLTPNPRTIRWVTDDQLEAFSYILNQKVPITLPSDKWIFYTCWPHLLSKAKKRELPVFRYYGIFLNVAGVHWVFYLYDKIRKKGIVFDSMSTDIYCHYPVIKTSIEFSPQTREKKKEMGLDISDIKIKYLGWQGHGDNDNCGIYAAWIAYWVYSQLLDDKNPFTERPQHEPGFSIEFVRKKFYDIITNGFSEDQIFEFYDGSPEEPYTQPLPISGYDPLNFISLLK